MPVGTLPKEGEAIHKKVYKEALLGTCKGKKDAEACAAKIAWKAVSNAGFVKDAEGNWSKKSAVQEFSLTIKSATVDKETGERRWRADNSNTEDDKAGDNMTQELFTSFLDRIEKKEPPPEEYTSDFWQGGIPYLSLSHYPDMNGDAIPGDVSAIYVDGKYLKSKGLMNDTPLGNATWKALIDELQKVKAGEEVNDKIRMSIAFLDYKHRHKSNDYIFERSSSNEICPECLVELIRGEFPGKSFMDGLLIHLAMTRVPMNEDTTIDPDMLEERSMTTRKKDAASIVGDELAEELEAKAKEVGKSEALVIKAEDVKEKAEVEEVTKTVDVPVQVTIPDAVIEQLKALNEKVDTLTKEPEPKETHPLNTAFAELKSDFDSVMLSDASSEEKLKAIQKPFEAFGNALALMFRVESDDVVEEGSQNELIKALSEVMQPFAQKLDLLNAQLAQQPQVETPVRRSIPASLVTPQSFGETRKPKTIDEMCRKSVGLNY
ncbi:MAG: hypothetical protein WBF08_00270 [Candidatus Bathyarchaeia archaeon]